MYKNNGILTPSSTNNVFYILKIYYGTQKAECGDPKLKIGIPLRKIFI